MPGPLYHHKPYLPDEVEFLRANHATATPAALARALGRTAAAVAQKAVALGLAKRPTLAACEARLRELHSRGLSDAAAGRALGVARRTVLHWRAVLGLPATHDRAASGRASLAARDRHARSQGYRSWGARVAVLRRLRADAEERGCLTPAQVACVRALRGGPASPASLAAATGRDRGHLSRVLRALVASGLVRRAGPGLYELDARPHRDNETDYLGRKPVA